MTTKEFSDQFDVLYNNITSNQAPGLNEYEKTVFLTKAQEEVVKNYFSPKGNPKQDGFDDSPKRQSDFANIIASCTLELASNVDKFDQRSLSYQMPSDLFICLNEQLVDSDKPITIVPISYTEYDRLMAKPYKFPPKYQAWRLITKNTLVTGSPATVEFNDLDPYILRIVSSYGKPVRMIITTSETAVAPSIKETTTLVTITCLIGIHEASNVYWETYLADNPAITPYLGDFSGEEGHSLFPNISQEVLESTGVGVKFADLTNPGGIPSGTATIAEIIGRFTNTPIYRMRYVRRPNPIILTNLADMNLSIHGKWTPMTSELSEELHEEILQRAVELAKIAWEGSPTSSFQAGQRSE